MKRLFFRTLILCSALALCGTNTAQAQYNPFGGPYGPAYRQPAVSPYLNLLNGGNPGINYYTLVRPEIEFRQRASQLEMAVQSLEQRRAAAVGETEDLIRSLNLAEPLRGTGHPATFGDVYPYYNMRGAAGRPATGAGSRPAAGGHFPGR
jgi:hypothetical protein